MVKLIKEPCFVNIGYSADQLELDSSSRFRRFIDQHDPSRPQCDTNALIITREVFP